jgi:hypothetical protein
MRDGNVMSDRTGRDDPIRVKLTACDWWYVPNRDYEKIIEIDREDWDNADAEGRREMVEEEQQAWLMETFGPAYEVLDGRDFADPVLED